jgi:glucose/arabinose dehydrogenase
MTASRVTAVRVTAARVTAASWVGATVLIAAAAACESDGPDKEQSRAAIEADASTDTEARPAEPRGSAPDAAPTAPDAGLVAAPNDAALAAPAAYDAQAQQADAASGGDDDGVDRDVLRPASRAPSDALIGSLTLPPGFAINVFARGLENARMLAVHGPHVYLTRRAQGDVIRFIDADRDGVAEDKRTVAAGLPNVHGIVIHEPNVYLATPTHVYRATLTPEGDLGSPVPIISDLPEGGQHPNRTLAIGPDEKLYISVGSPCDACPIDNPEYATLLRAELDGSRREIFARGLRNTIGFGWHPSTGVLWGMDHGSDWRGDDIPPEELNRIEQDKDYGWPYCYGSQRVDPVIQQPTDTTKEAYCPTTTAPVLENQAHQAPIGLSFYTATQFPERYRNSAFVAFRGSWNRIPATGYKIARVVFDASGQPTAIEDFVTGFLIENGTAQFGRLAGTAIAQDGSLLFTDDENGVIYRVSYSP